MTVLLLFGISVFGCACTHLGIGPPAGQTKVAPGSPPPGVFMSCWNSLSLMWGDL